MYDEGASCSPSRESIYFAFAAVLAICLFCTLLLAIYLVVNRNDKVILTASRNFMFVSLIGAQITYISLFMFYPYPTDGLCAAQVPSLLLYVASLFLSLFLFLSLSLSPSF
tara:strand:- start:224 stop:556 length:333 start_codon:yes stop_codon:yes gene_type:complete